MNQSIRPFILVGAILMMAIALPNLFQASRSRAAVPQSGSAYADFRVGKPCTVLFSDASQGSLSVAGAFRSANETWIVVDGVNQTVLFDGKTQRVSKEYWIPCVAISSISFVTSQQGQ